MTIRAFSGGAILFIVVAFSPIVWADGMAFDRSSFSPLHFREQRAAIRLAEGRQKMVIALNGLGGTGQSDNSGAVWIFPVPGDRKAVTLDVADRFPLFFGADLERLARRSLNGLLCLTTAPLVFPIPIVPFITLPYGMYGKFGSLPDDTFHEVDKWGIHAEIIKAGPADRVALHLKERGLSLDPKRTSGFEKYLSDEYSLVLVWVSSQKDFSEKFPAVGTQRQFPLGSRPCVYVEFPAEKGFYPLRATSGYGDKPVQVTLFLMGFVSVDLSKIKQAREFLSAGRKERFRIEERFFVGSGEVRDIKKGWLPWTETAPKAFVDGITEKRLQYTRIRMRVPASSFEGDLTFTPTPPASVIRYRWLSEDVNWMSRLKRWNLCWYCLVAVLAGLFSYASGWAAGLIVFRNGRKYATLGLWTFLTTIALWIAVRRVRRRMGEPLKAIRFTVLFTFVYSALFLATLIGLNLIL